MLVLTGGVVTPFSCALPSPEAPLSLADCLTEHALFRLRQHLSRSKMAATLSSPSRPTSSASERRLRCDCGVVPAAHMWHRAATRRRPCLLLAPSLRPSPSATSPMGPSRHCPTCAFRSSPASCGATPTPPPTPTRPRWTLIHSPTPGAFLYVTTDGSDPRTSPTAIFREDWDVTVGPRIMLRINTPGITTVKAVASRGDLPDSPMTICRYNISAPAAQCLVAATSMNAPAWVR